MPEVSIIIPTLNRPESLKKCLSSIKEQTYKDYEIILVEEEGELAKLRNQGARRAQGKYLVFIDDDIWALPNWLSEIVRVFKEKPFVGGVSGPARINRDFRLGRDIFRYSFFKWLYDQYFLGRTRIIPGYFSDAGAWSTRACDEECVYAGPVEYLEACNMAYRRDVFFNCNGFDETYKGVGDFSEPDLSFRVRKLGFQLWFSRNAVVYHEPSRTGAFKKRRADSGNRLANYELFAKRWIRPTFKHEQFKWFLRAYYFLKSRGLI